MSERIPTIPDRREVEISAEDMTKHLAEYDRLRENLIEGAMSSRNKAISYRGFKVGFAMLTVDKRLEPPSCYSVYSSANVKPFEGFKVGWEKTCAETISLRRAIEQGDMFIVGMVSASHEKSTGDSQLSHDVLHPCENCRSLFRQLLEKGMIRAESLICNVNDKTGAREETTVADLLRAYENGST